MLAEVPRDAAAHERRVDLELVVFADPFEPGVAHASRREGCVRPLAVIVVDEIRPRASGGIPA